MRQFDLREANKILINAGFELKRMGKGDHRIYSNGTSHISIPFKNGKVNPCMFRRLCKENNISC